jgi:hypothetical protein
MEVKSFVHGQRVRVLKDEDGKAVQGPGVGTVTRVLTDGVRAWVTLDDAGSGTSKVCAYPEDCEPAVAVAHANRAERRAAARTASEPAPTIDLFGKDHWSTFAYIETLCVDNRGVPSREHMRCHAGRHPLQLGSAGDGSRYPTRLKDGSTLANHDDWDCADDLETEGLIENVGSGVNPAYRMTDEGWRVGAKLREHKATGGVFHNFEPASVESACGVST